MTYKFTNRAKKAIEIANDLAIELGHNYIGTEHILYGLSKEGSGVAAKVLENQEVEPQKILDKIDELIGREDKTEETLGFTPRTKRVIENAFIGHIGGDDIVAIIPTTEVNNICQEIIATFDKEVSQFFTPEDLEKGYIEVANRKGIMEQFTLTSISIGAVIVEKDRFENILEIGEVGAQVKHVAKSIVGSSYAIDRRHV